MRVPASKGISPYAAPREVPAAGTTPSQRDPHHQSPEQNSSVEVHLSARVTSHATYLQMLKTLPEVRSERVEEVRRKLAHEKSLPESSQVAAAILAHHTRQI